MKERPILMNRFSVRALLDGRKTQTRRVVKPQPPMEARCVLIPPHARFTKLRGYKMGFASDQGERPDYDREIKCRYGVPGEHLWVRESWELLSRNVRGEDDWYAIRYVADGCECTLPCDRDLAVLGETGVKPSIFMPHEFSRFRLKIVDVRVERVQEITRSDILAEGLDIAHLSGGEFLHEWIELWDSINAGRGYSWENNPWLWVIAFEDVSSSLFIRAGLHKHPMGFVIRLGP